MAKKKPASVTNPNHNAPPPVMTHDAVCGRAATLREEIPLAYHLYSPLCQLIVEAHEHDARGSHPGAYERLHEATVALKAKYYREIEEIPRAASGWSQHWGQVCAEERARKSAEKIQFDPADGLGVAPDYEEGIA